MPLWEKTTGQILKSSCSFNENVLFFSEKNKVFKKKNKTFSLKEQELFKIWPVVFFHNGIYMPKRLIFPSDLSAPPQTPCPPAFRLKDIPHEMFQPENILQNNHSSENKTGWNISTWLKDSITSILQPKRRRAGCLRRGWSLWRIFQDILYREL